MRTFALPLTRLHLTAFLCAAASAAIAADAEKIAVPASPRVELPDGYSAEIVAAAPLVQHPIMATVDDRGRLFVGDSSGVNLNKAELEKELPHRVLMLEDTNGDGVYDKSTVFADKLTFPQGCVWLDGSLYVASPPGIWRFTDTDGDGVADKREMIVRGFDYTGNAADIHGPFLHPNGRLYWCHGRKGHEVYDKDGNFIRKGKASGIWSCKPDGTDVRMHAGGGMDNPVEIDFTPDGEILGTVNLFFGVPRGDCIVHWLRGGVYPRDDQGDAIAEFKRSGELLQPVHNFGHVAVSGCTFYRSGALNPDWRGNLFVTHFNTQRVTRMVLERAGASFKVAQREFLKIHNLDVHLTDVLEDRDGTLLVVDTGGWFRAGCPSSLIAKPDITGAIYRVRSKGPLAKVEPWGGAKIAEVWRLAAKRDTAHLLKLLSDENPDVAHAAANALASLGATESSAALSAALSHSDAGVRLAAAHALGTLPTLDGTATRALLQLLEGDIERSVEHQAMDALLRNGQTKPLLAALRENNKPALQRRALIVIDQIDPSALPAADLFRLLDSTSTALAQASADIIARRADLAPQFAAHLAGWVKERAIPVSGLALIEQAARPQLAEASMQALVTALIQSNDAETRRTAWRLLASSSGLAPRPEWTHALKAALSDAPAGDVSVLLDAIAKVHTSDFELLLKAFAADEKRPVALRIKALSAGMKRGSELSDENFALLRNVLMGGASISARIEAARVLASSKLAKKQFNELASSVSSLGPLELRETLKGFRRRNDIETGTLLANELKNAPALASLQESEVRTLFSGYPPTVYAIVAPALAQIATEEDARRRQLDALPTRVIAAGRAEEGRKLFESGKGTCIACHRVGTVGNLVGPDLSTIGQIRTERDLLESIMFPNATLVREFEPFMIETAGGESLLGVVRRRTQDSVVIADAAGQEHAIPKNQIASMQQLPNSLMPTGLERTVSEQELLDLVAYLRSRK